MNIWPHMDQRSDQWFRARAGRPTASNFDRIFTGGGKISDQWESFACMLVKQSVFGGEISDFTGNEHTERGEQLEPMARQLFAETYKLDVREVGFVTREDGIVGCSPDGLIYINGAPMAGLEIKCPTFEVHAGYLYRNELPREYYPQVHGSLAVTGLRFWYFVSYCEGLPPLFLRVEWNDYTAKISEALDGFVVFYSEYRDRVLKGIRRKEAA